MNRLLYRALIALAALVAAILVALPVWDHWYYGSRFVGAAMATTRSVAPAIAEKNAGASPGSTLLLPSQLLSAAVSGQDQQSPPAARGAEASPPLAKPESLSTVSSAGPGGARAVAPRDPAPSASPVAAQRRATANAKTAPHAPAVAAPPPASSPSAAPAKAAEVGSRGGSGAVPATHGVLVAVVPANANPVTPAPGPASGSGATPSGNSGAGAASSATGGSEVAETAPEAPPHIALLPGTGIVAAGETLVVKVALIGGRDISGVPFHLSFNPDVLEFVAAREGSTFRSSSLSPILLAGVSPERPGDLAVGLSLIGSGGLLSASGDILELEFRGLRPGSSSMQFDRASLRGAHGETLSAQFFSASVTVR